MTIRGRKSRFTDRNVKNAPSCDGVYVLSKYGEVIYIGKGKGRGGVKSRLLAAKRDKRGRGKATSFQVERSKDASRREKRLLEQYLEVYGRLPRYNDRVG